MLAAQYWNHHDEARVSIGLWHLQVVSTECKAAVEKQQRRTFACFRWRPINVRREFQLSRLVRDLLDAGGNPRLFIHRLRGRPRPQQLRLKRTSDFRIVLRLQIRSCRNALRVPAASSDQQTCQAKGGNETARHEVNLWEDRQCALTEDSARASIVVHANVAGR